MSSNPKQTPNKFNTKIFPRFARRYKSQKIVKFNIVQVFLWLFCIKKFVCCVRVQPIDETEQSKSCNNHHRFGEILKWMVPVREFSPLVHTWISIQHSLSFWKRPRHKILARFLLTSANKCKYSKIDFLLLYQLNSFHLNIFANNFRLDFYWFGRIFVYFNVWCACVLLQLWMFNLFRVEFYSVNLFVWVGLNCFRVSTFLLYLIEFQYFVQFQFFFFSI